ncbi:hypothetical protein BV22DRAFT_1045664 [Leucogyrophana mollusca]|uniref:Uncharacterized protein n=1 Tax=Leucogyrophana mollusca TaxID=85980 RepID=A0ACB8BQB1_9AGAM|nr:hypothetical protein BV22DRAFT_1045664 [Leucogyrophana mollusca]
MQLSALLIAFLITALASVQALPAQEKPRMRAASRNVSPTFPDLWHPADDSNVQECLLSRRKISVVRIIGTYLLTPETQPNLCSGQMREGFEYILSFCARKQKTSREQSDNMYWFPTINLEGIQTPLTDSGSFVATDLNDGL